MSTDTSHTAATAEEFASICKNEMLAQRLSAEALAAKVSNPRADGQGVAKQTLLRWFSGRADMKVSTLQRIAKALGFELRLTMTPFS